MVAEFMEFEVPEEPQMGDASDIQEKYYNRMRNANDIQDMWYNMVIDVNDDLQDEIGERRSQFMALMNMIDSVEEEIEKVRTMCIGSLAVGGCALCVAAASMIL